MLWGYKLGSSETLCKMSYIMYDKDIVHFLAVTEGLKEPWRLRRKMLQGMPRRISDYPDAFAGWNLISSFGSIISVVATALFLYVVYEQLVYGKAVSRNPWLAPQFFYDLLQVLLNRSYSSLEWALTSPPKPHPFVSLPLQSSLPGFSALKGFNKIKPLPTSTQGRKGCSSL